MRDKVNLNGMWLIGKVELLKFSSLISIKLKKKLTATNTLSFTNLNAPRNACTTHEYPPIGN